MRAMPALLEQAFESGVRQPAYKILAYDAALDSISTVVRGEAQQTPFDLTPYVTAISWSMDRLTLTLTDPEKIFQPDYGASRQYLRDKAIIRLREGDSRVPESDWMNTFTGFINGQVGWIFSRRTQQFEVKVTVYNRAAAKSYNRSKVTSSEYTVGTEAGVFLHDFAGVYFGLTAEEIRIPRILGFQMLHKTNQLVQVTPAEGLEALLETVAGVSFFDGDGRLAYYTKSLNRATVRVLPDYVKILDYSMPESVYDGVNRIQVIFLSAEMEEIESPYQKLGSAQVTTGFFTNEEKLDCYWSDDRKQRARNTRLKIIKSVNDNLLPVGTESYVQLDDFHGQIIVTISFWVPMLAMMLTITYLAASFIPDEVIAFGAGVTIPVGRVIEALALIGILMIMMSLGSAQYEVWGTPYEMAYVEKQYIAEEDGLEYWEVVEKEIKNDFVGSYEQAQPIAIANLIWEKSLVNKRMLLMTDDLTLELGDIIQLPSRQRMCVTNLTKTIKRGEVPLMTVEGFKVLIGSATGVLEL